MERHGQSILATHKLKLLKLWAHYFTVTKSTMEFMPTLAVTKRFFEDGKIIAIRGNRPLN